MSEESDALKARIAELEDIIKDALYYIEKKWPRDGFDTKQIRYLAERIRESTGLGNGVD